MVSGVSEKTPSRASSGQQIIDVCYTLSINNFIKTPFSPRDSITLIPHLHADLELVFQLTQVFLYYGRTLSEDICDLLDCEQALLSEEQHRVFYCLHRHSQDLRVMGHHSLKTACGGK